MPTKEELKELQSKSLEEKIQISTARIIEWYETWGGQVYVSFSGGKDSTVLLDLVRRLYPNVEGAFCDTGLEFPELRDFVKKFDNIRWLRPTKYNRKTKQYDRFTFPEIIKHYGYPIISKRISEDVHGAKPGNRRWRTLHGEDTMKNGAPSLFNSKKWNFLLEADFKIGANCCNEMKKKPMHRFQKESGKHPIIGTQVDESLSRKTQWLQTGCNAFEAKEPISTPIAFWTEQDILSYIKKYNLAYAPVYGDLVEGKDGKLHFTGCQRTGCVFCGFGCHLEKEPNRFQRLAETHPKLYGYCINGGQYNENGVWQPGNGGLGMGHVLDYIGVNYEPIKTEE